MSNLHTIYDVILSNLSSHNPELIYFSIGCALGNYDKINPNENQQYPYPIFNKYEEKKKIIILMDQHLEKPLKIESDIKLQLVNDDDDFRILNNNDTIVFAINSNYYFESDSHLDCGFLINLIIFTLSNKNKLIIQNFSGYCINNSCIRMFDYFPKDELISNVIFDVSNSDGTCRVDFNDYPIRYDEKDNFIQIKFYKLTVIKNIDSKYFSKMITKRIDNINYELTRKLRVLRGELQPNPYDDKNIQTLFESLNIIYPEIGLINEVTEEKLIHCITVLLTDICKALNIGTDIIKNLIDVNFNQSNVINALSPLKALVV